MIEDYARNGKLRLQKSTGGRKQLKCLNHYWYTYVNDVVKSGANAFFLLLYLVLCR